MSTKLASFPNSRFKFRSPTRVRDQQIVSVGAGPGNTLLIAENANRTNLTLRNEGPNDIRYDYFDNPDMASGVPGEGGFLLQVGEAFNEDALSAIYAISLDNITPGTPSNIDVNEGEG